MVVVLQAQLTDNLDEGLRQRSDTIAAVLVDAVPQELPGDEDLLIQVVLPDGEVVASSANLAGAAPIAPLEPGLRRTGDVPGRTEEFRVLSSAVDTALGPAALIVGDQFRRRDRPGRIVSRLLAATVPAVVLILAR